MALPSTAGFCCFTFRDSLENYIQLECNLINTYASRKLFLFSYYYYALKSYPQLTHTKDDEEKEDYDDDNDDNSDRSITVC